MKSMRLPSAAIFFMTYFHRARAGPWPRRPPPDPLLRCTLRDDINAHQPVLVNQSSLWQFLLKEEIMELNH